MERRREQGQAQTLEDLIVLRVRLGVKNPKWRARKI